MTDEFDIDGATDDDLRVYIKKLQKRNIFNEIQKNRMQRAISSLSETELVQIALNDEQKKPISLQRSGSPRNSGLLRPVKSRNIDTNQNIHSA